MPSSRHCTKRLPPLPIILCALLLSGCASPPVPAQLRSTSGTIDAINHTNWAINRFSVDGRNAVDIIGPYQGGGGGCCFAAPAQWRPGMTVRVDWETGVGGTEDFPGYGNWPKFVEWAKKVNSQTRLHSQIVPIPDYTGQDSCGITVHFLPCDQLQVTTSCLTYDNPNYPVKLPLNMPEPTSCPK